MGSPGKDRVYVESSVYVTFGSGVYVCKRKACRFCTALGRRLYIIEKQQIANPAYQAEPVEWLKRLDKTNWESKHPDYVNYTNLANDAAAAYQLALRWKLSDEAEYGDAAKTILNAWAKNCKVFTVKTAV